MMIDSNIIVLFTIVYDNGPYTNMVMADRYGLRAAAGNFDSATVSLNFGNPYNQNEPNKPYSYYYSYFYAKILDSTRCIRFACLDLTVYGFFPFQPLAVCPHC
jgi:hypothetical protein